MRRSDPQMIVVVIRATASVGASTVASGTFSTATLKPALEDDPRAAGQPLAAAEPGEAVGVSRAPSTSVRHRPPRASRRGAHPCGLPAASRCSAGARPTTRRTGSVRLMAAQMPATVTVILGAVKRLLTALGPMTPEQLLVALHDAGVELGRDPEETLADLLDSDELPLVMPLIDERHALLPALLDGRVFTHRLSAAEIEQGLVAVSPDLEPLSMLADSEPYQQLLDGAPLAVIFPDLDADLLAERGIPVDTISEAPAFLLPPDRLRALGLRPGGLVGFRITGAGVDVTYVDEGDAAVEADADVGTRLAVILAARGDDGPDQLDAVVWTACADDPDLFRTPLPPLADMLDAAGLACETDQGHPRTPSR